MHKTIEVNRMEYMKFLMAEEEWDWGLVPPTKQ